VATLTKMGFSWIPGSPSPRAAQADLWVRPPGAAKDASPVFVEPTSPTSADARAQELVARWSDGVRESPTSAWGPSILVVGSDASAELAGTKLIASAPLPVSLVVSRTRILVHPRRSQEPEHASPHWHRLRLPPRTLLMLATGTLVGLAQRSPGGEGGQGVPIDVEGMLRELRRTFLVDIEGSLGVKREEDAMFLLYQLALKETYAPGDQGASLHELVNDPKGPAARLPWFAI
jgi:hypothetical protein